MIVSGAIADFFETRMLWGGLTYSGHPVCCAAAVANLRIYEEEHVFENVEMQGRYLAARLEEMKDKYACVGDVRYKGLFSVIELVKDKATKEPLAPFGRYESGDDCARRVSQIAASLCFFALQHALGLSAADHHPG